MPDRNPTLPLLFFLRFYLLFSISLYSYFYFTLSFRPVILSSSLRFLHLFLSSSFYFDLLPFCYLSLSSGSSPLSSFKLPYLFTLNLQYFSLYFLIRCIFVNCVFMYSYRNYLPRLPIIGVRFVGCTSQLCFSLVYLPRDAFCARYFWTFPPLYAIFSFSLILKTIQGEKQTCNIELRHLYKRIYFHPGEELKKIKKTCCLQTSITDPEKLDRFLWAFECYGSTSFWCRSGSAPMMNW